MVRWCLLITACFLFARQDHLLIAGCDWAHWRGPNRNGIVDDESGFRDGDWPLTEGWKASVGEGSSSPLVIDGLALVMGWGDDREHLIAFGLESGEEMWRQSYPAPRYGRHSVGDKSLYSGISATPEYDEATGYLYSIGIDGDLYCRDLQAEGVSVWHVNLYDTFKTPQRPEVAERGRTRRDYGYTAAPLVINGTLLVEVGATDGTVIGFDKLTGEVIWKSECQDPAGHTGGMVIMEVDGRAAVVVLSLRQVVVMWAEGEQAGQTVASFRWTTDYGNNIVTPVVNENSILVTSAYNHYAMCRLDLADGELTPKWQIDNPSGVCTPIVHDGHVYWAWRGVHCVDWETGVELWKGGKVGSAGSCLITADERLIVFANRGELSVVETVRRSPESYQVVAEKRVPSRQDVWPHVVLSNGHILVRDRLGTLTGFRVGE